VAEASGAGVTGAAGLTTDHIRDTSGGSRTPVRTPIRAGPSAPLRGPALWNGLSRVRSYGRPVAAAPGRVPIDDDTVRFRPAHRAPSFPSPSRRRWALVAVAVVAIGLTAVAGLVVSRSGGGPAQAVIAAAPSVAGEDTEPVARGGRLAGSGATPSPSASAGTEPPAQQVADEPAPTRSATAATTASPAGEPSATEDAEPARCTKERGPARGKGAPGRGGAACR
jgi:hypothetical protein